MNDVLAEVFKKPLTSTLPHYRVQLLRDGGERMVAKTVNHPDVIVNQFKATVGDPPQEHLWVYLLDKNNRMIGDSEISIGCIDATICDPADVMRFVINSPAPAFVIIHNHPGGDPTPSAQDKNAHQNILEASRLFRRPLLDAIIVGNGSNQFYSAASSYDLR